MSSVRGVVNELVSSEVRYLSSLSYLVLEVVHKVEQRVNPRHLQDLYPFFALLKSLLSFHSSFHSSLTSQPPPSLPSLFLSSLPSLRLYQQYAEVHPRALHCFRTALTNSSKFRAACEKPAPSMSSRLSGRLLGPSPSPPPPTYDVFALLDLVLSRPPQYSAYLHGPGPRGGPTCPLQTPRTCWQLPTSWTSWLPSFAPHPPCPLSRTRRVRPWHLRPSRGPWPLPTSPPPALVRSTTNPSTAASIERRRSLPLSPPSSLPATEGMGTASTPVQGPASIAAPPPPPLQLLSPLSSASQAGPLQSPLTPPPPSPPGPSTTTAANPIFRYVPRIVLHRYLGIDAALRATSSPAQGRGPTAPARRRSLALSSYLPSSSSPEARAYPSASILVADVSGFTKLNETFSVMEKGAGAEQVTNHLNKYFTALLNIIGAHGGDCVKFAGDALIVLFLPAKDWRQEGEEAAGPTPAHGVAVHVGHRHDLPPPARGRPRAQSVHVPPH